MIALVKVVAKARLDGQHVIPFWLLCDDHILEPFSDHLSPPSNLLSGVGTVDGSTTQGPLSTAILANYGTYAGVSFSP